MSEVVRRDRTGDPFAAGAVDPLTSDPLEDETPQEPSAHGVGWSASRTARLPQAPKDQRAFEATLVKELPDRRGAYTRVFQNRDGSLRVEEYLTPIHYRTSKGWQPIDNAVFTYPSDPTRLAIVMWIERTYHRQRRQRALGKLTPIEFETVYSASEVA